MGKKSFIFFVICLIGVSIQYVVNIPNGRFNSQPQGWPGLYTVDSLSGLIAKFNLDMIPAYLSSNDNARILSYASMAYNTANYEYNGGIVSGKNSFNMVISDITNNITVKKMFIFDKNDKIALKSFMKIKNIYSNDGYNEIIDKEVSLSKDYIPKIDRNAYIYKPPYGHNSELEKSWGLLKPIGLIDCKINPPPLSSYNQLLSEAEKIYNLVSNFKNSDNESYANILFLITHYTGAPSYRNEPARLLSHLVLNIANDSKLDEKNKDYYIMDSIIAIHNSQISAWYYKYKYMLVHPLSRIFPKNSVTSALPNGPSYPSEYATISSSLLSTYKRYNITTPVRLEIRGNIFTMPTTRVFKNFDDFAKEFSEVPLLSGYNYSFDIEAGNKLGKCVAGDRI